MGGGRWGESIAPKVTMAVPKLDFITFPICLGQLADSWT